MGLGALSVDQGAQKVLKEMLMDGAAERLECERKYNAQMTAAEAKRTAAGGSGSGGVPPAQSAG
jgi:hypothetical protein